MGASASHYDQETAIGLILSPETIKNHAKYIISDFQTFDISQRRKVTPERGDGMYSGSC